MLYDVPRRGLVLPGAEQPIDRGCSLFLSPRLESTSVIIQRNGIQGLLRIIHILHIYLLLGYIARGNASGWTRGSERRARGCGGGRITRGAKHEEEGRSREAEDRRGVALPRVTGWVKSRKEAFANSAVLLSTTIVVVLPTCFDECYGVKRADASSFDGLDSI